MVNIFVNIKLKSSVGGDKSYSFIQKQNKASEVFMNR